MRLIGRAAELGRLAGLVSGVGEHGGALVLRGDAGIGKSALLAAAGGYAADAGVRVLTATGAECEQRLTYAALQQVLHPIRAGIAGLPVPQRDALRAALGEATVPVPGVYLVGLAVLNLLAELAAGGPLLLVVEDAHWLDRSSADVLTFVARRLDSEPIVLLAAVREGVASPWDSPDLPTLPVGRLSERDAADLLDAGAPALSPAVRRRLLEAADGNPLALSELPGSATALESATAPASARLPLTARLERAFTARVSELAATTRTVLLIAALSDGPALPEVLRAAALVTGERVDVADLAAAVRAGLVHLRDGELLFRHPLMRSAIAQAAGLDERCAAHDGLARVLDGQADRRAWHRAAAALSPDEAVASELESTADRAEQRGGVVAAIAALEHAARLSVTPARRAERLLRAATLAVESGRQDLVQRLLDEAVPLDLTARQRAMVSWIRGGFDDGTRDESAGARGLARLAETVAADGDVGLCLRILWSAALRCFWTEPGAQVRAQVVAVAETLPIDPADPRLLAVLAYASPIERGTAVIERLARLSGTPGEDALAERFLGTAALLVGATDVAARLSAASLAGLRVQGRLGVLTRALAAQAWGSVRLADLGVAIPATEEAGRLALETNQPLLYSTVRATEAELAALRGDFGLAYRLAGEAEQLSLAAGIRPVLAAVQAARGLAALGEGRFTEGYAHLRRMHDPTDPAYHLALRCYSVAELAEAAARSGQGDAVRDVMADLELIAARTSAPALHAGLRHARAVLAPDDAAEDLYLAALGSENPGWIFVRARTRLAFGEWLRRRRRTAQARDHLRAARETFDALGAAPWGDRARLQLRAAGETSPGRAVTPRDRLTAHELHIAQLAGSGLTNKEIGQRLYLSHRTVSSHLHRIFPKLGVASRAELRAVVDHGDGPAA